MCSFDIDGMLIQAQIDFIIKEVDMLKLYLDDRADNEFIRIICTYEYDVEEVKSKQEKLDLAKKMYEQVLRYTMESDIERVAEVEYIEGL